MNRKSKSKVKEYPASKTLQLDANKQTMSNISINSICFGVQANWEGILGFVIVLGSWKCLTRCKIIYNYSDDITTS